MTGGEHRGQAYLPAVDGLRAVAILSVVAFHIGTPGITGGFVGVDIFFVISGFLIIGQIEAALRRGSFSFFNFYARRTLRILPPLFLVLVASTIAAFFLLVSEREFERFGGSLAHAALMVVNHYFLGNQGYFDTAADLKPLLHTWTLSVEEQFYLLAPPALLLLFLLARPGGRRQLLRAVVVACLFAVSLLGCIFLTRADKNYAFYLMPLRAWEFIAGGAIGALVPQVSAWPRRALDALSIAGAALVAASFVMLSPAQPFPSLVAVIPVAGAAVLILAAVARPSNPVARLLATPPMVAIGLVSYSWYLWHWPGLAFLRISAAGEPAFATKLLVAAGTLALAAITYLALERPIRNGRGALFRRFGARRIVAIGVAGCCFFGALGFVVEWQAARLVTNAYEGLEEPSLASPSRQPCAEDESFETCLRRAEGARVGVLVGDSHALNFYRTLFRHFDAAGVFLALDWKAGCAPLAGVAIFKDGEPDPRCSQPAGVLTSPASAVDFAVLKARWAFYAGAESTDPGSPVSVSLAPADAAAPGEDQRQIFEQGLRATIAALRERGVKRILLVGPTPELRVRPVECVAHADRAGRPRETCAVAREEVDVRIRDAVAVMRRVGETGPDTRFIDPTEIFCDVSLCRPYDGNTLLYGDDDHLSPAGEERLYRAFEADFAWVRGAR